MSLLSKLNDSLYLGDYAHVEAAATAGCTAIVNVATAINYTPPAGVDYNKVGLVDGGTDSCRQYEAVIDTINGLIAQGEVVYLHCLQGINRGPMMAELYYHEYLGYSWDEAQAFVLSKHADAAPWAALRAAVEGCFPDAATESSCPGVECCADSSVTSTPVARTVYQNEQQSATANCAEGYTGDPVTVTIAAQTAAYNSYISVADANAKAYAAALAQAAAALTCVSDGVPDIYWNTEQTATCEGGQTGNPVTVAAGTYSSPDSQNAADALALAAAEAALDCGIQGALDGLLWEMPCTLNGGAATCSCADPADQSVVLNGAAGVTYNVTLRIRGVIELRNYTSGSKPTITVAQPADGTTDFLIKDPDAPQNDNPYNIYELVVSSSTPSNGNYYINHTDLVGSQGGPIAVDYQFTVQLANLDVVGLIARNVDTNQVSNRNSLQVADETGLGVTQPYNGQFAQLSVISVTAV